MGKTSSSHKKKRTKISSQARTRKISKSKSRKYRSKKLRRRDDSVSYSDDGDSRSLESVSSFSSEDDSRRRKDRSRTRKDVKASKKKARRRSSSSDSSVDSPRGKKRKVAKKKNDYDGRKKSQSRKKPRRNASISSRRSASFSCSTCPSESISADEIESKRHRGRPGKRNRDVSVINNVESRTKRARYRSSSCSSRSQRSESGDCQSVEKVAFENNMRRLRSVITIADEGKHGRWMDKDGHKEEITYDDDYPSCRSNDSNDGGCKRELDTHLHVAYEKSMEVESGKEEEVLVSNVPITDLTESGNIVEKDCGDQDDDGLLSSQGGVRITGPVNEYKEVSGAVGSLPGEDLESILRRRALENLKRFKGKHQRIPAVTTNQEDKSDNDLKQSFTAKAELVQVQSSKESGPRVVVAKSSKEDVTAMVNVSKLLEEADGPPVRDSILSSQILEKELDRTNDGNEFISAKLDVTCPTDQVGNSNKKVIRTAVLDKPNLDSPTLRRHSLKPNLDSPTLRRHSLKAHSMLKQAPASLEPRQERLLMTESSVDKSASGTTQTVPRSSNSSGEDINNGSGSVAPEPLGENSSAAPEPLGENSSAAPVPLGENRSAASEPSGENSSDIQQGEATDGSQFEQKTMSVMRGSEMVQVSYKVYIPKKAPALARRQLRR